MSHKWIIEDVVLAVNRFHWCRRECSRGYTAHQYKYQVKELTGLYDIWQLCWTWWLLLVPKYSVIHTYRWWTDYPAWLSAPKLRQFSVYLKPKTMMFWIIHSRISAPNVPTQPLTWETGGLRSRLLEVHLINLIMQLAVKWWHTTVRGMQWYIKWWMSQLYNIARKCDQPSQRADKLEVKERQCVFKSRTNVLSSSYQSVSRTARNRMYCGPSGILPGSPHQTSVAMETEENSY